VTNIDYAYRNKIAKLYYEDGESPLSDEEWDAMEGTEQQVGYTAKSGVTHLYMLWSLHKSFSEEGVWAWMGDRNVVETDKLDGAAVSLVYNKGLLIRATSRGNGKEGIDITKNVRLLKTVPWEIDTKSLCQIDGEVVAPSSIRNARNYASGALNLKDVEEFKERRPYLSFVVHDIRPDACCGHYINPPKFWSSKMDFCDSLGFHTDLTFDATDYPTDGKVFRLDNLQEWEEEGFTSHHPRGSIALKEQKEGVVTKLLDVVWQTGKSGVVTPVAELEPVMIGDAQVSRATLHNMQYIEELGLEIGCSVEVIRSGEIIPRIVRRVN
jgi:DNA ligase (NAD+)